MKHSTFNIQRRTSNGRARHSVRADAGPVRNGAHGVTRPTLIFGRWMLDVGCWMLFAFLLFAAGCATFQPQPVSPEKTAAAFDARSLSDDNLRAFLETNH